MKIVGNTFKLDCCLSKKKRKEKCHFILLLLELSPLSTESSSSIPAVDFIEGHYCTWTKLRSDKCTQFWLIYTDYS